MTLEWFDSESDARLSFLEFPKYYSVADLSFVHFAPPPIPNELFEVVRRSTPHGRCETCQTCHRCRPLTKKTRWWNQPQSKKLSESRAGWDIIRLIRFYVALFGRIRTGVIPPPMNLLAVEFLSGTRNSSGRARYGVTSRSYFSAASWVEGWEYKAHPDWWCTWHEINETFLESFCPAK